MAIQFKVPDMACDACAKSITQAVQTLDSGAIVKADTQTKQVTVETLASESSVRDAIAEAGYNPV
ncbi:copper chaperone [Xenococcus sp. PCC 7305]|uniref:heavy-metal-associated domain-containing protein n=1 Tax=Xenococcus sp. PCC 7305 TaxID=102125 RepID=UPI0002ABF8B3|nr:heavy-metal-associated domain-containing protein [Xenococcus sp. PCC 7305]ELS01034.1 copper chaperone [Xenococcus sp. PCC 7305]